MNDFMNEFARCAHGKDTREWCVRCEPVRIAWQGRGVGGATLGTLPPPAQREDDK